MVLVMPDGDESWYTNSAERPQDRYEDYITQDLVADVENRFPAAAGRAHRAVMGVSMGGFGAVKLALRHPELYAFAGGLSAALDAPGRPFSVARIGQYRHYRSIFGAAGQRRRCCKDALLLSHLRRHGRLAGDQSKFRATSRAAPLLLRISRRPGRALLGTVECRAGRRIRQSPGASGHTKGCSQPEIALRTLGFPEKSRSFAALRMTT
ncbi:MAG: hypothetical protein DMG81_20535 [Acidobacteria bacterium]|nr:MAG: hypothetical protein DMG81_20535 [Acidobacteriota bacterium]